MRGDDVNAFVVVGDEIHERILARPPLLCNQTHPSYQHHILERFLCSLHFPIVLIPCYCSFENPQSFHIFLDLDKSLSRTMSQPKVLFVLSSHGKMGSTGKPTGWYLVMLSSLVDARPMLKVHSLNSPTLTTSLYLTQISLLRHRPEARLPWILAR